MKKLIVSMAITISGLIGLYAFTILWWRFWMYHGLVGPIPFLHWFIESDGERSYDLTQYEMFLHLVLIVIFVLGIKKFSKSEQIHPMTRREIVGLVLLVAGSSILPLGWIISHKILVISVLLIWAGVWLFYTERIHKQEEQLAKESAGNGSSGTGVPGDLHNYTGWRTGGRTQPLDSFSSEGESDGD